MPSTTTRLPVPALLLLLAACGGSPPAPAAGPAPAPDAAGILRQCARENAPARPACYETALLSVLRTEGVAPAMARLEEMGTLDEHVRRDGHVYAHAIGLAAYTTPETVGPTFGECSPAFQSGCFHGVIQSYFADHAAQHGPEHLDAGTVNALCEDWRGEEGDLWRLFQCAHGMGHGLTMVFAHHLPRALEGCDLLGDAWEREACYGGAFMENVVQATVPHHGVGRPGTADAEHGGEGEHAHHAEEPAAEPFRALDPGDPLYPCTVLDERYLSSCYQMQTSAILYFNGGDMRAAVGECDRAPEAYRSACYQSLGRDISAYTVQDHREAARLCSLGDPRWQPACHAGYAKNLVDLTADAADGLEYCRLLAGGEGKVRCYTAIGEEIWVLERDPGRREAMCAAAEPAFREACRAGASLAGKSE